MFNFSRWRPSAILDFQKFVILTAHTLRGPKCVIVPNFVQIVKPLRRYDRLQFFKMAAVRHLGFLKVGNFNCPHPSEGQNASSYRILCRSVKMLRRYGRLQFFKMAAVRHLGFKKVQNFNCSCLSEGQIASSCQILCKSVKALQRYGHFRFFKMAAVRHLGFVIRVFGPPTKCILVVSITMQNLV